jgi:hypothetical protein
MYICFKKSVEYGGDSNGSTKTWSSLALLFYGLYNTDTIVLVVIDV